MKAKGYNLSKDGVRKGSLVCQKWYIIQSLPVQNFVKYPPPTPREKYLRIANDRIHKGLFPLFPSGFNFRSLFIKTSVWQFRSRCSFCYFCLIHVREKLMYMSEYSRRLFPNHHVKRLSKNLKTFQEDCQLNIKRVWPQLIIRYAKQTTACAGKELIKKRLRIGRGIILKFDCRLCRSHVLCDI